MKNYPGEVRLVYRHFPLPSHPNAIRVALAAECAGEQGKFWQMHDAIFLSETALDESSLESYVSEIGMDKIAFERCLSSEKYLEKIQEDIEAGEKYGVSGTPTFFINGYRVMGFRPDMLEQLIEQELGK